MMINADYQLRPIQYLPNTNQDIEVLKYYFPDEEEVEEIKETLH